MKNFIALLRGINVGGNRKVLMADLKSLLEKNGMSNVITYIQSGNVLFSASINEKDLEILISKKILEHFGFEVPVLVRTQEDWRSILNENPFLLKDNQINIERLYVTLLSDLPSKENIDLIKTLSFGKDEFIIIRQTVYILLETKYNETKLTNTFFENKLKAKATSRNWKTVNKLAELST